MTTRVRVTDAYMLDKIALLVSPAEGRILEWQVTETECDQHAAPVQHDMHNDPAVLTLPEGVARAIYEALGKHFGGGADVAALRRDYDAERKRVDVFIAHMTGGAR